MNSAKVIFLSALLLVGGCMAFVLWPRGHQSFVITDVSQPFSASVTSPIRPLGSVALFVFIEGQLDGDAVLEVTSNGGRDQRAFPLRGPQVSFITGGADFTPDDLKRYSRLSSNRQ